MRLLPSLGVIALLCGCAEAPPPPPSAPPPPPPSAASALPAPSPAPSPPPEPAPARYSPEVEQRIERVVRGLLPETALPERFAPVATLADRMAHFHTPGV